MAGDSVELRSYPVAFGPAWSTGRLIPSILGTAAGVTVIVASQLRREFDGADSLETLPEWVRRVARTVLLLRASADGLERVGDVGGPA